MELLKKLVLFSCMVLCIGTMAAMQNNDGNGNNSDDAWEDETLEDHENKKVDENKGDKPYLRPRTPTYQEMALVAFNSFLDDIAGQDYYKICDTISLYKITVTQEHIDENKKHVNDWPLEASWNAEIEELLQAKLDEQKKIEQAKLDLQKKLDEIYQRIKERNQYFYANRKNEKDNKDQLK